MALQMMSEKDGTVHDTIDLVDGKLTFSTGAARRMFNNMRRSRSRLQGVEVTDAQLFEAFTDWSNGYITIK
jgi:hypothetical protein